MPEFTQRSFTSGEIAPALRSRADLVKYSTGLALCSNFMVRPQGGVYTRPGLRFIGTLSQDSLDNDREGRLVSFSFNTEQTYILVFEHLKIRFIRNGSYVLDTSGPGPLFPIYELTTPYTESELPFLGFTQNADVMTIVHPNHDPMNLNRFDDDDWTLTAIDYSPDITPPTFAGSLVMTITNITQANPAVVTISAPQLLSAGNSVTIADVLGMTEVNNRTFKIDPVGIGPPYTQFELRDEDSSGHTAYSSGGTATLAQGATTIGSGAGDFDKTYSYVVTAVDEFGVESLQSSTASITTKSLSETAGVRLQWAAVAGTDYYRIYKDPSVGTDTFGWIGDSRTTQFDDYNIAPIVSDSPPQDRRPFTGTGNKPSAVTYYQQRQVFSNTFNEPQVTYTTQVGIYDSLRTSSPARSDDAVTFTIAANQVNEIRHLLSLDSLVLLTSGGEWIVTEGQDRVLTPSTVGVRIQSYNGSSWVPPVVINSTALYVQEKGGRIRDLGYEFSSDKYTGNDLSLMSEHLFDDHEITAMAYAAEPYGILWCIRDDGVLLGLTYQREHQVWGWHQHATAGEFESVAVISEDGRDAPYFIVKRTLDGQTVRLIERMEPREQTNAEDCFYVDSGVTYDGPPVALVSGFNHLIGEEIVVLADGNVIEGLTPNFAGSITLDFFASKVHGGIPYMPAIETLDIDIASSAETLKADEISISKVTIEVEASRGGWVGPVNDPERNLASEMLEIKPRFDNDSYGAMPLRTFKEEIFIDAQWNKGGGVRIEQRAPLPLAVLSIIPKVDVGGN